MDSLHCWLLNPADDEEWTPLMKEVAGESCLLWVCRHCEAWMEVMPDDSEDELYGDEEWTHATAVREPEGCCRDENN